MQLLLISEKSVVEGKTIGDIVGLFPDDHEFSVVEKDLFSIVPTKLTQKDLDSTSPEVISVTDVYLYYKINGALVKLALRKRPMHDRHYENGVVSSNLLTAKWSAV
jgi:hypothetical protein